MDDPTCPQGDGPLLRQRSQWGLRFPCPHCAGLAVGIAPLREELADGVAAAIWTSSQDGPASSLRCPFCGRMMARGEAPSDPPGGATVEVCRPCEMVWLPAGARDRLAHRQPPDAASRPVEAPVRCEYCGAPFEVVDGCCRYCKRLLLEEPTTAAV